MGAIYRKSQPTGRLRWRPSGTIAAPVLQQEWEIIEGPSPNELISRTVDWRDVPLADEI